MPKYVILNKPFQVLCQFTDSDGRSTLADFVEIPDIYSAGRLDFDSEGLLVITDDGNFINGMMSPRFKVSKTYFAQVEGQPTEDLMVQFRQGLTLKAGLTSPAKMSLVDEPTWLWERIPPIRERKQIPTSWLKIEITEGKNRQVRRMTAAIGCPTLRLIRYKIGELSLDSLGSGQYIEVTEKNLKENGLNWSHKKSSPKAAFQKGSSLAKRSDQRQLRSQRSRSQNQIVGKTRPDSH